MKTTDIINFIKSKGYKEIASKSRKYRTFKHDNSDLLVFIGKRGAVRKGKTSSQSISITENIKKRIEGN